MQQSIGVLAADHVAAGLVEDNRLIGPLRRFPAGEDAADSLQDMPAESIIACIGDQVRIAGQGQQIAAIGVGVPGIIREGVVEDSPNRHQLKGLNLQAGLAATASAPVLIVNDADAMAAGIAATLGLLDKLVRVWTLGTGIGFGRYPRLEGIWEAGHCVVTLDPKEQFCGCGGVGHLEGIMGNRGIRLRFFDLEPEEVFENAAAGDERCRKFVKLWHRALAAATASSIHLDGPGKFYISGPNSKFVETGLLHVYLHEMVKMSPLQGSFFEVIPTTDEIAIIGAAVSAERAL